MDHGSHVSRHGLIRKSMTPEQLALRTRRVAQEGKQEMLRADELVVELHSLYLGARDELAFAFGQSDYHLSGTWAASRRQQLFHVRTKCPEGEAGVKEYGDGRILSLA